VDCNTEGLALKVERLYRRQENILRDICQEVGYRGRYVWLVIGKQVEVWGPAQGGVSHIRYRAVRVEPKLTVVSLQRRRTGKIHIGEKTVVTAIPLLEGRRRTMFVFMHPALAERFKWSKAPSLCAMPEEMAVLNGREKEYHPATAAVARVCCILRELVTPSGKITEDGLRILRWFDSNRQLNESSTNSRSTVPSQ
jgi:hypothetical protein